MSGHEWKRTNQVAWTQHDGPGRPPRGPGRVVWGALSIGVATVFLGALAPLCPEHRLWVNALAGLAFVGVAASVVGLFRRWALAPLLTAGVCAIGVGIGLIDATHAPERGIAFASVFGVLAVASLAASAWVARLWVWDRHVARLAAGTPEATAAHEPVQVAGPQPVARRDPTSAGAPSSEPVRVGKSGRPDSRS